MGCKKACGFLAAMEEKCWTVKEAEAVLVVELEMFGFFIITTPPWHH
jgi:hypothetical protein